MSGYYVLLYPAVYCRVAPKIYEKLAVRRVHFLCSKFFSSILKFDQYLVFRLGVKKSVLAYTTIGVQISPNLWSNQQYAPVTCGSILRPQYRAVEPNFSALWLCLQGSIWSVGVKVSTNQLACDTPTGSVHVWGARWVRSLRAS